MTGINGFDELFVPQISIINKAKYISASSARQGKRCRREMVQLEYKEYKLISQYIASSQGDVPNLARPHHV